jgi:hypothetical protein
VHDDLLARDLCCYLRWYPRWCWQRGRHLA